MNTGHIRTASDNRPAKQRRCKNCDVALHYFSEHDGRWLCEDCCRIGKRGAFLGGLVVGLLAALIKLIG